MVAQRPTPGTSLRRDSLVRINVSNGPNAKPAKAVPDVSGEDEATARADLQAAGFRVSVVDQPTTDENEDGLVLDQDPPARHECTGGLAGHDLRRAIFRLIRRRNQHARLRLSNPTR